MKNEDYGAHLLELLPYEITQLIARESEQSANDYDYVKSLLLKKFKLSPEKHRQKFVQNQKSVSSSWSDFVFEITTYFEEWIIGLDVGNFDQSKELMITDQLKRRVPNDYREHYVDDWSKFVSPKELVIN